MRQLVPLVTTGIPRGLIDAALHDLRLFNPLAPIGFGVAVAVLTQCLV